MKTALPRFLALLFSAAVLLDASAVASSPETLATCSHTSKTSFASSDLRFQEEALSVPSESFRTFRRFLAHPGPVIARTTLYIAMALTMANPLHSQTIKNDTIKGILQDKVNSDAETTRDLVDLFKSKEWTNFLDKPSDNSAVALLRKAEPYSATLRGIVAKIVENSPHHFRDVKQNSSESDKAAARSALNNAFKSWAKFNDDYMVPHGLYGVLFVQPDWRRFTFVLYALDEEATVFLGDTPQGEVIMGQRIDNTSSINKGADTSESGLYFEPSNLIIENSKTISDTLATIEEQIKMAQRGSLRSPWSPRPNLTQALKNIGLKTTPGQRRSEYELMAAAHEWSHSVFKYQKYAYGLQDHFGMPERYWKKTDFEEAVTEEVFCTLFELRRMAPEFAVVKILELEQMIIKKDISDPHYWTARYVLFKLGELWADQGDATLDHASENSLASQNIAQHSQLTLKAAFPAFDPLVASDFRLGNIRLVTATTANPLATLQEVAQKSNPSNGISVIYPTKDDSTMKKYKDQYLGQSFKWAQVDGDLQPALNAEVNAMNDYIRAVQVDPAIKNAMAQLKSLYVIVSLPSKENHAELGPTLFIPLKDQPGVILLSALEDTYKHEGIFYAFLSQIYRLNNKTFTPNDWQAFQDWFRGAYLKANRVSPEIQRHIEAHRVISRWEDDPLLHEIYGFFDRLPGLPYTPLNTFPNPKIPKDLLAAA